MIKLEIERLKVVALDIVTRVQELRRQGREINDRISAVYKEGRANGIDRRAIKLVLAELHETPADAETIWQRYASALGIGEIADDNVLDAILSPHQS